VKHNKGAKHYEAERRHWPQCYIEMNFTEPGRARKLNAAERSEKRKRKHHSKNKPKERHDLIDAE